MIGVVYSVRNCETMSPPTMAMPSGRRRSEPAPCLDRQRQTGDDRAHGRHHDRPKPQQARLVDGVVGAFALVPLGFQREVDHHDRVLLDDADQKDDADKRDQRQVVVEQHQRQERADASGRQRRQDRDRVDEALVEHPEHHVDDQNSRQDQQRRRGERRLEGLRRALEGALQGGGQAKLVADRLDRVDRLAQRRAGRQIERQRHRREKRPDG